MLQGGIERVLKVKMNWSEFDTLWTFLDSKRSGDLDIGEFKAHFGDLSEFEESDGAQVMSAHGHESIEHLTRHLYKLCDVLRHAGFSVDDAFAGFDRNGSHTISLAEFCSLLRVTLGHEIDKKSIYRAWGAIDSDGSRSVSLREMRTFVYRVWKSELHELNVLQARLDERLEGDRAQIARIGKERDDIKSAIKRNFPRQWRDELERMGTDLPGPFMSLFSRLGFSTGASHVVGAGAGAGGSAVGGDEVSLPSQSRGRISPTARSPMRSPQRSSATSSSSSSSMPPTRPRSATTASAELKRASPLRSRHLSTTITGAAVGTLTSATSSAGPSTPGRGSIMRVKLRVPSLGMTRTGAALDVPVHTVQLAQQRQSAEVDAVLRHTYR